MLANEKLLTFLFLLIAILLLFAGARLYNISLRNLFSFNNFQITSPFYEFSISLLNTKLVKFDTTQLYEIEQKLELSNQDKNEVYDIISRLSLQLELGNFFNKKPSQIITKNSWEITYHDIYDLNFLMPIQNGILSYNDYFYPGAQRRYRNGIHQGIDLSYTKDGIKLPKGSPIFSISEGVIVKITDYKYYSHQRDYFQLLSICKNQRHTEDKYLDLFRGKQIQVRYKNYLIIYCHLNEFNDELKVGMKIKKGTLIGYMGNSGVEYIGSSPHLHLEIYLNNFILGVNRFRNSFEYEYNLFDEIFNKN